ncbi:MAG: hypothetical protein COX31_03545 [Candidatus Moranbacteria bacterium CG23_combo_of_CG06-09_8_20_14_all_40_16]|nr:MAG: hypothetical protein COX31_03545 [Candidatus Moranbacteria bacterium CG23_combo_of_CG06-09_8_20_14_all_40_16]
MTIYIVPTLAVLVIGILIYFRFRSNIRKSSITAASTTTTLASSTPISPGKNWLWIVSGLVAIAIIFGIYLNHHNDVVEKKEIAANVPATGAVPTEKWKLCWKKPEGHPGKNSLCDFIQVEFLEQGFRLKITAHTFFLVGERVGENTYEGKWENATGEKGDFSLVFSPDFLLATGWVEDSDSHVHIYTWLTKWLTK